MVLSSTDLSITAASSMMWGVEAEMGVGPVGFSVEQQNLLWAMWRRGDSIREMERPSQRGRGCTPICRPAQPGEQPISGLVTPATEEGVRPNSTSCCGTVTLWRRFRAER